MAEPFSILAVDGCKKFLLSTMNIKGHPCIHCTQGQKSSVAEAAICGLGKYAIAIQCRPGGVDYIPGHVVCHANMIAGCIS
jgi:hypothetical protein